MAENCDFTALCLPNRADLLGFAIKITKNKADAEDLVQDTLCRAFKYWATFAPEPGHEVASARGWLFCILKNQFNSIGRRAGYVDAKLSEADDVIRGTLHSAHETRDPRAAIYSGVSDEQLQALELLDDNQRAILLRFSEGESYKEIAMALGIPIGTVMSRLWRARKVMVEALTGVDADGLESTEELQPKPDRVNGVVAGNHGGQLVGAETALDACAAG